MAAKQPLLSFLGEAARGGAKLPAAFGAGGDLSREELRELALRLAASGRGDAGARWLLQCEDAARVAVVLLAAAVTGARVVLPPNLQPGTLAELAPGCTRVFGDEAAAGVDDPLLASASTEHATALPIDRDAPLVELYTSGSSGRGKLVVKALRHLEDEVVELERLFGAQLAAGSRVFATVPAQHLYGLLFRVLWPLAAGRAFTRTGFLLPEDLLARIGELAPGTTALVVSSPAHLRHLAASSRLAEQAPRIAAIFSSGGPLETATALAIEKARGAAPVEIFGSTETGGVAWRRATREDEAPAWKLFGSVSVDIDADGEALVVRSPFVTPPGEATPASVAQFRMGDRAERAGEGFRLLGRSDRVAKVGEKTLSLPELEARLASHELVERAALSTYRSRSGARLGAIVVLTAAGRRSLAELGRRTLQQLLAEHLAAHWDRIALPRRWRFRDELPADARGKLTQELFETQLAAPAGDVVEALRISAEKREGEWLLEFVVPRDLAYLEGHYETFPLVPGAVQLHWVLLELSRLLGRPVSPERMDALKFKSVLRPAQAFTMRLAVDGAKVQFTLSKDERVFSSGRLLLAQDGARKGEQEDAS